MGQDFDEQRREAGTKARQAAAARDANRQEALVAGARAPTRAEGDPAIPLRFLRNGLLGAAALAAALGLIAWGSAAASLAFGAAILLGAAAAATHRVAGGRGVARRGEAARLDALAGRLAASSPVDAAHAAARGAVERADLSTARRQEALRVLEAAHAEVRALAARGLSGEPGGPVAAQVDAFVQRCRALADELAASRGPPPESALGALDALADDLRSDLSAAREIDAAITAGQRARQRD